MSSTPDIAIPMPPTPIRAGSQATAIEQSRAAAQVYSAVLVAHERPRSSTRAIEQMLDSCQHQALADRAFFRYNRGGGNVTGPSVHLARELARCWGNVDYGLSELSRDDVKGESEMLAYAWDLETNARTSHTFIVKHVRDTKTGRKDLTDQRDIYENNANNGARRVREAIFNVLPVWFREQAIEACTKTIREGGGVPLPQRIAGAVARFAEIRVSEAMLVRKIGAPTDRWTAHDVAQLGVIFQSISRGEVTKDEEFPPEVVSGEQITAAATKARRSRPKPADPPVPVDEDEAEMLREQQEMEAEIAAEESGS